MFAGMHWYVRPGKARSEHGGHSLAKQAHSRLSGRDLTVVACIPKFPSDAGWTAVSVHRAVMMILHQPFSNVLSFIYARSASMLHANMSLLLRQPSCSAPQPIYAWWVGWPHFTWINISDSGSSLRLSLMFLLLLSFLVWRANMDHG